MNKQSYSSTFTLTIRQHHLDAQHPDVAETLYHFAHFHQLQQQSTKALSLYQQALTIYDQTLGPQHPKTNSTRIAYTHLLREMGHVEEAVTVETAQWMALGTIFPSGQVDDVGVNLSPKYVHTNIVLTIKY